MGLLALSTTSSDEDFREFTNALASKHPLSKVEKAVITRLIEEDPSIFTFVPPIIPNLENAMMICALAIKYRHDPKSGFNNYTHVAAELIYDNIKTTTDILGLAMQLAGDKTLVIDDENERNFVIGLLNYIKNPESDVLRHKKYWLKIAKNIDLSKYREKFSNAYKVLTKLQEQC